MMEVRSGLREGIGVAMRIQNPVDQLKLIELMRADLQPLYEAWSEVWTVGSKEAIAAANDVTARCETVVSVATQHGEAGSAVSRFITGEKWTPEQLTQWSEEIRGLAETRRRLAVIARREARVELADLFASNERKPAIAPPVSPSHVPAQDNSTRP
jgi:hypothetical protein